MSTAYPKLDKSQENYFASDEFKKLIPYLLSGGAAATAGAVMTGGRRKDKKEGRLSYLGRILSNALIAGGLGGGAHYLVDQGLKKTLGSVASDVPGQTGGDQSKGPLENVTRNVLFSPLTATAAGVGTLLSTQGMSGIGAGNTSTYKKALGKILKMSADDIDAATPGGIASAVSRLPAQKLQEAERLRRLAGVASDYIEPGNNGIGNLITKIPGMSMTNAQQIKGSLSEVTRKGLATLGQTTPRRVGRAGLGLAAASVPAIIGAMLTSDNSKPSA